MSSLVSKKDIRAFVKKLRDDALSDSKEATRWKEEGLLEVACNYTGRAYAIREVAAEIELKFLKED